MAIVVEHTPYDALFSLATQAGEAQAAQTAQAQRDREQLAAMQIQADQRKQQFMVAAEQRARQEEMQYQTMLIAAKRQIDMQVETSNYARQKQMLTQTLNMINDSNEFDEREKEQLSIEVMSKYSGLGSGISPSSFGGTTGMSDFLQKGAYKMQLADQLQGMVDSEQLNPGAARQAAASFGLSGDFATPGERHAEQVDEAVKRYDRIQDTVNSAFVISGGKLKDKTTKETIKKNDPRYGYYETLKAQRDRAKSELDKLHATGTKPVSAAEFADALQKSPALQQMVQLYGEDAAFEAWSKKFGGQPSASNEDKPEEYGFMKKLLLGSLGGVGGQAAVLKNMAETRNR